MRIENGYYFFWKDKIFNNWKSSIFKLECLDGKTRKFYTSEQSFMALKAQFFNDEEIFNKIINEEDPKICQELGRTIKNFNEEQWKEVREDFMFISVFEKFVQNEELKNELLKYSHLIFVETSPYDKIWGIGISENDDDCLNEKKWKGLNLLGKTLSRVAEALQKNIKKKKEYK